MDKNPEKWEKWPMCLHKYFQENCRYDSYCFRRLKYTYWATSHPNIMTPRPIQQKGPTFLGNCCLFSHFWPIFDQSKSQYQDLVNTCWPDFRRIFFMPQRWLSPNIISFGHLDPKKSNFKGRCSEEPIYK